MILNDIRANMRVQVECEHSSPAYRNMRGIVLAIEENTLHLVTDFGELVELHEDKIINVQQIQFPKIISDSLVQLRNHFQELYELKKQIKLRKQQEQQLIYQLFDANFLARFNIHGAKTRLDNSIPADLRYFKKDTLTFDIHFESNPNNQIELHFIISNHFEYYNLADGKMEQITRIHAPQYKDILNKAFPYATTVEEGESKVVHEQDSFWHVRTFYCVKIDVTQGNFLAVRERIIKSLQSLY